MAIRPLNRTLSYGVLAVYLLVVIGSALGGNPVTDALRVNVTRPVEKVFGIHQTWPMFAKAPRRTVWLTLHGERADGGRETLDVLPGRPDADGFRATYDRLGKLQRNAAAPHRKKLRMGIVRWVCRTEKARGRPLRKLQPVRRESITPAPGTGRIPRDAFAVTERGFERWNCR